MDQELLEFGSINEMANELTADDVAKLCFQLNIPVGVCDKDSDGVNFILALRKWKEFNPYLFYQALTSMNRPDLIAIASNITGLCVSEPTELTEQFQEPLSIKTLLSLLRTEISQKEWKVLAIGLMDKLQGKDDFETIITVCLEKQLITSNLIKLRKLLTVINRLDIVGKIKEYQTLFAGMSEDEFISKMKRELSAQANVIAQWESKLKLFISMKSSTVTQILGDDEAVSLKSVFVDITILKQKPRPVKLEDETTYNEIAYLRKIAKKEIKITTVDFTEELKTCKAETPEIWNLIGNSGCGKTFLAKRTALRFSQSN